MGAFFRNFEQALINFGDAAWGTPLLVLILGGGIVFLVYSRFLPYLYLKHAVDLLRGRYDNKDDPGDLTHFQALSAALAATIGMGNLSGVAVAISTGGPGAIFWMWVSALVGAATKFFTCTLAVMYRGRNAQGRLEGGPMYVIVEGLGPRFRPLAVFFAFAGIFACLPLFVSNQLTRVLNEILLGPVLPGANIADWKFNLLTGSALALVAALVIFGGVQRIGRVSARLVPSMTIFYVLAVLYIFIDRRAQIPEFFHLILSDAFTGHAVAGGALGTVILQGVRRAAFSNEAGIGTEALAHGAAKTKDPVREGLVAMLGPFIDTLVVCTMTASALILTGAWKDAPGDGISKTMAAFRLGLPTVGGFSLGQFVIALIVLSFSLSTIFSYSYYGSKCLDFLLGGRLKNPGFVYKIFYVCSIVFGSVLSVKAAVGFVDGCMALMAIPTMTSTLLLAPRVMAAAREYFAALPSGKKDPRKKD